MAEKSYSYTVTLTYRKRVEDVIAINPDDAISQVVNDDRSEMKLVDSETEEGEEVTECQKGG